MPRLFASYTLEFALQLREKAWKNFSQDIVYVLLGISPASVYNLPMFRNHVSVPSSKAGSSLCGVSKGKAIYTVAGNGTGAVRPMGNSG